MSILPWHSAYNLGIEHTSVCFAAIEWAIHTAGCQGGDRLKSKIGGVVILLFRLHWLSWNMWYDFFNSIIWREYGEKKRPFWAEIYRQSTRHWLSKLWALIVCWFSGILAPSGCCMRGYSVSSEAEKRFTPIISKICWLYIEPVIGVKKKECFCTIHLPFMHSYSASDIAKKLI